MEDYKAKYGVNHPAFNEWTDHLPLSLIDLIGIKTYQSILPQHIAPHYMFYGEYTKTDLINDIG